MDSTETSGVARSESEHTTSERVGLTPPLQTTRAVQSVSLMSDVARTTSSSSSSSESCTLTLVFVHSGGKVCRNRRLAPEGNARGQDEKRQEKMYKEEMHEGNVS